MGTERLHNVNNITPQEQDRIPGGLSPRALPWVMAAPQVNRPVAALGFASIPVTPGVLLQSSVSPFPHLQSEGSTGVITVFLVPCMLCTWLSAYPGVELPLTWLLSSSHHTSSDKETGCNEDVSKTAVATQMT